MSLSNIAVVADTDTALNGFITALTLRHKLTDIECTSTLFIEQLSKPKNNSAFYLVEQDLIHVLKSLGLSEQDLITHCDGNIHFGEMHTRLQAEPNEVTQVFNSRAPLGVSISGVEFHHLLTKSQQTHQAIDQSLASYSLVGKLYTHDRFMPPSQDKRSIASSIEYAIVVNAAKFQDQLANLCSKLHISTHQHADLALINQTEVTPIYRENALGKVNYIQLGSGELTEQYPIDFVFDTRHSATESTQFKCSQYRWTGDCSALKQSQTRCQHEVIRLNEGLVQCIRSNNLLAIEMTLLTNEQAARDAACAEMKDYLADTFALDADSLTWTSTEKNFRSARIDEQDELVWSVNTINLASSASNLSYSPMRRTPICDIVDLWLTLFPAKFELASDTYAVLSKTFNQLAIKYLQNLHDFEHLLLSPTFTSTSTDGLADSLSYSPSLQARIDLFENTGTDYLTEQDCIAPHAWRNLAFALSYWPKNYDPVTDNLPDVTAIVNNMAQQIDAASKQAPSLAEFFNGVAKAT